MTERNTEIMRDAFRLLSAHESPPDDADEGWWASLAQDAARMAAKWKGDEMAFFLADAIVSALSAKHVDRKPCEQTKMAI